MEQTPKKILCGIWERSDRLGGSKAPGRDAAGEGSGVLRDPCAPRLGGLGGCEPHGVRGGKRGTPGATGGARSRP